MRTLAGTYQNFRPTENPDQAIAYKEALERMVQEFGNSRVAIAIQKACDLIPDFVPTPAKIREFIPLPGPIKTCTLCHPSGFVMVYEGRTSSEPNSAGIPADGGNPVDPKFGAAKRCDHQGGYSPVAEVPPDEVGRMYGVFDIKALAEIHRKKRAQAGRALTEKELDACVDELDRKIDAL
jgi:hypothetical protein